MQLGTVGRRNNDDKNKITTLNNHEFAFFIHLQERKKC